MINNRTSISKLIKSSKNKTGLQQYRANATISIKEQADVQYKTSAVSVKEEADIRYKKDLKNISKEIFNDLTEYLTPKPNYFNRRQYERAFKKSYTTKKLPITINSKSALDTEEHVSMESIEINKSPELQKISIGWDTEYRGLMNEFIELYQSLDNCGPDNIPVKLIKELNHFLTHKLPACYFDTFFAYSFKVESDKTTLKTIVNILMNTYNRCKINDFRACSGNILDNIIFNHMSAYDSNKVLDVYKVQESGLTYDTENISKTLLLNAMEKYIHRMEYMSHFELGTETLIELLDNCLDGQIPNNHPNLIQRCLNLIGKGIVLNQKSHYAPRSSRNPFQPWIKLSSIQLSTGLGFLARNNLEEFALHDSKNKEIYNQQLKSLIFSTNWKIIDPNNFVGGSVIEFLGMEEPEILDDYITSNYLNTNKSKNLRLNNDVLKSICMTYCQLFDVHKAVNTIDILLKHDTRLYDSMSLVDVSYKVPYATIMSYLLEDIMASIRKTTNVSMMDQNERGVAFNNAFSMNGELLEKYEVAMGIQQIIVNKTLEARKNSEYVGDVNNTSGHIRTLFDSYMVFLRFLDFQSEKVNLDFIDYFKSIMADELRGAAGIEYKGFDEVMYLFHTTLYNILPRLSNVEIGEEFIDYFYTEILIKHCIVSEQTINYARDAEIYKNLFREKFAYHAACKAEENKFEDESVF